MTLDQSANLKALSEALHDALRDAEKSPLEPLYTCYYRRAIRSLATRGLNRQDLDRIIHAYATRCVGAERLIPEIVQEPQDILADEHEVISSIKQEVWPEDCTPTVRDHLRTLTRLITLREEIASHD